MMGTRVRMGGIALLLIGLTLVISACSQPPDFTVSLSSSSIDDALAGSVTSTLQLASQNNFTGTVHLSLLGSNGHPAFGEALSPSSVMLTAGQSESLPLTLSVASGVPVGTYDLTLRATGAGETHTLTFTLALTGNGNGTFSTSNAPSYPVGGYARSVAIGDFNGDGHPDIAVADDATSGTVTVLLNNGNGTFPTSNAPTYPAGIHPYAVAVGDFNDDGWPDLAIADSNYNDPSSSTVTVLLNNGDGTFPTSNAPTYPAGTDPYGIAVGDFNGDGWPDLAIADDVGTVTVLLNNGDGTFPTSNVPMDPAGSMAVSAAVEDYNGDGWPDLAIANYTNSTTVTVLLNNGDGTFPSSGTRSYSGGALPWAIAAGDFDGDGTPDLVIPNVADSNVTVLLNAGDGTFSTSGAPSYAAGSTPISIGVGDFNSDGKPDLAVADDISSGTVTVLLNDGHGAFPASGTSSYAAGINPCSVAVGDFNSDGKLDLAIADYQGNTVTVLLGQ